MRRRFSVPRFAVTAFVVASASGVSPHAQEQGRQTELAQIIQNGGPVERHHALAEILAIPPEQRQEDVCVVLARELERVAQVFNTAEDARVAGQQPAPMLPFGGDDEDYFPDLIRAVGEWRDLRALKPLIVAGRGMLATEPIVRFGEAAVPQLIAAARSGHQNELLSAAIALQLLLRGSSVGSYHIDPAPLSSATREQILLVARDLLRPGVTRRPHLATVAGLALATGDYELHPSR